MVSIFVLLALLLLTNVNLAQAQFLDGIFGGAALQADVSNLSPQSSGELSFLTSSSLGELSSAFYVPGAQITLGGLGDVLIGDTVTISATFTNNDADPGYGPYIDFYFPANGADGQTEPDGLSYVPGSANYLGASLVEYVLTFPDDGGGYGCVDHPVAYNGPLGPGTLGSPREVCGPYGDQLVVIELPFGSFVPGQSATIELQADLSNFANLYDDGTTNLSTLEVRTRGGYIYGQNELDDPCCDGSYLIPNGDDIASWPVTGTVTPFLMELNKEYIGPENETATGPNYPRQFRISVDVAEGQTLTGIQLEDVLPNNIAYLGIDSLSAGCAALDEPTVGAAANPPDNNLVVQCTVTGGAGADDIVIVYDFFVPLLDADGIRVLPTTGSDSTSQNTVQPIAGTWNPLDGDDDPQPIDNGLCPTSCPGSVTLSDQSIAIQKSAAPVGTVGSGTTVVYTLEIQISDYFAVEDIIVIDTLSDGQHFDNAFPPQITVYEHGTPDTFAMDPANYTETENWTGTGPFGDDPPFTAAPDGTTDLEFRISDEFITQGFGVGGPGQLLGACVPDLSEPVRNEDCSIYNDGAPTTIQVVYQAIIQDEFTNLEADVSVDHGDVLDNSVTVSADILSNNDLTVIATNEPDGSADGLEIDHGTPTKNIYAVTRAGVTTVNPPGTVQLAPGDDVTFRITYTLPSSDFEDLNIVDFFPLPVFRVGDPYGDGSNVPWAFDTTWPPAAPGAIPAPGEVAFGPTESFYPSNPGFSDYAPTLTTNVGENTLTISYGDYDDPANPATTIDLLFTMRLTNEPFADGLLLTNQALVNEGSTNGTDSQAPAIVQIEIQEPVLHIKKGVVDTDNADVTGANYDPNPPAPVTFDNSVSPPWAGVISSGDQDMNTNQIDSNLIVSTPTGADGSDIMTFAIVIENVGSSSQGAFDITLTDTLPPGFIIPVGGINLQIWRGDGVTPVGYTPLGPALDETDLFNNGIELDDSPFPGGVCAGFDANNGTNMAILTYDLQIDPNIEPGVEIINVTTLTNYAGEEGGENHVGPTPSPQHTDDASVTINEYVLEKNITDTSQGFTAGTEVVIGEEVEYTLTVQVPEGQANNVTLTDQLDAGLEFVSVDSITGPASGDVTTSVGTFADVITGAVITPAGDQLTLNFGTLTNLDTDGTGLETLTIVYTVLVQNVAGNQDTPVTLLNNGAAWNWDTGHSVTANAPDVEVIEPILLIQKDAVPNTGDAGDTIAFTITITHDGATPPGFDLIFQDPVPAELTNMANLDCTTGSVLPTTCAFAGATLNMTYDDPAGFGPGDSIVMTFDADLIGSVVPGQVISNAAGVGWTSLPGALPNERTYDNSTLAWNDYRASDDADITVVNPTITKEIIASSNPDTDTEIAGEVVVGETVTYQTAITVPEGQSTTITFEDVLDEGLAFVSVDSLVASPILTTSVGTFADVLAGFTLTDIAPAPVGDARQMNMDFGTVTNSDTNNANAETITITYTVVVLNSFADTDGDILANNVEWQWGTTGSATGSTNVNVVEADMQVTKDITNLTAPYTADAGDIVTYELIIEHTGASNADAYNVTINDAVPFPDLIVQALSLNCNATSAVTAQVTNLATTTCTFGGTNTLNVTWDAFPQVVGPDPAVTVITFDAVIADTAEFDETIDNTATLQWTSMPGDLTTPQTGNNSLSVERTGDITGPGEINDYEDTDQVSFDMGDITIDKSVFSTSVADTGDGEYDAGDEDLTIGETVDFDITITLAEGTAPTLTVVDNLPTAPAGILDVTNAVVVAQGGNVSVGGTVLTITDSDGDTYDDTVTFEFTGVTNAADNVVDANDYLVIRITAILRNVDDNNTGDDLVNEAEFTAGTESDTATADVDVVEPVLTLDKTFAVSSPASGSAILGSTIDYTLTLENTGTAPAYFMVVDDTIPTGMTYVPASITAPVGWTANDGAAPDLNWTSNAGTSIAVGDSVTFTYQVTIDTVGSPTVVDVTDAVARILDNNVEVIWQSLPAPTGDERTDQPETWDDYTDTTVESVEVINPDLRVVKDDGGAAVAAGAPIPYTVTFFNDGSGTATSVVLTETVPTNTTFDTLNNVDGWVCVDIIAGSTCTLTTPDVGSGAGILAPGETGSVSFPVIIDSPLPAGVASITNTVRIDYDEANDGPEPTPANNEDTITTGATASPDLAILKDDYIEITAPNSVLRYELVYDNVGTQDATGVYVLETVSQGTTFNLANSTAGWEIADTSGPIPVSTGTPATDGLPAGTELIWTVGNFNVGDSGTIYFAVTVDADIATQVPAITVITNEATVGDDETNGPDINPADNTDDDNDVYATDIQKTLIAINEPLQGPPLPANSPAAIGAILTYQLEVTVPSGDAGLLPAPISMTGVTVVDELEQGLAFLDCVSVTADAGLDTTIGAFADACTPNPANPTAGNPGLDPLPTGSTDDADQARQVTFDFDTVTNNVNTNQTITIEYQAVVLDSPGNVRGVELENEFTWSWDSSPSVPNAEIGPTGALPVTIVEPTMSLVKTVAPNIVIPGQIVTYTLTVVHDSADSDAIAYDVALFDTIPVGLSLVPGSFVFISGLPPTTILEGPTLQATWDTYPLDETSVFQFQAIVGFIALDDEIINRSNVEWTSLPGLVDTPQSPYNVLSTERDYDPLSNVDVYAAFAQATIARPDNRDRRGGAGAGDELGLPDTGFAPDQQTVLPDQPAELAYQDIGDIWLEIPSLGVQLPIVGVPFTEDGWDVTWLDREAGYLEGTAAPTQKGNTFITAHVFDSEGQPGPFVDLHNLGWGDTFSLHAYGQEYVYQVVETRQIAPNDMSILWHDSYDRVTLLTCLGYDEEDDTYRSRVAVQAILVEVVSE
ncbi:MAG: sortase [Anaerolineales bacterium]|nr:sortase [Anaerolineales bacterium]